LTHTKIDPRSPGKSTQTDEHCDPHDHLGDMSPGAHEGLGRDGDGNFQSMSRGGTSEHGDDMVEKYRPGRKGSSSSDAVPSGAELNEEGDGYADNDREG
jgi:hypothetical protein